MRLRFAAFPEGRCPLTALLPEPPDCPVQRGKLRPSCDAALGCRGREYWDLAERSNCAAIRPSSSGSDWKPKAYAFVGGAWI